MRYKYLLAVLFAATTCLAESPFQADRYFKNTGGLFDHTSLLLVPPDKGSDINNYMLDDRGQLTARSGFNILNATGTLTTSTAPITGGGYHNSQTGSDFFAIVAGTNVYRGGTNFNPNVTYTNITSTVVITGTASNLAQHTSINDVEVFCNELDPPFKVSSSGNAFALVGAPSVAKTCTTYISYLLVGNTTESGTSYPNRIRWSDINNPDSWPANNYFDIEPNDGDQIKSIIAFKDSVYVFKRRSIYRVLSTGLSGADAFIIRPFSRNLGAYAKNSVRIIPNVGIAFLAAQTAYILGDNELSSYNYSQIEAIGDPIQRTFDKVQNSQWANVVGAVYPQRYQYWLSVSTAGSTNTEVLVYDWVQKGWTKYSGVPLNMMDTAIDNNGKNVLITGGYSGDAYEFVENQNFDNPRHVQTEIATSYTTGWLTQNTPEYNKSYKYLYIFTQQNSTASLTVSAGYDYGTTFETTYTVGFGSGLALYNTAKYDTDTYATSGIIENRFELNREAKAIQLKFAGSSATASVGIIGWTIVYQNLDWKQ
jgi:hypothetical protein